MKKILSIVIMLFACMSAAQAKKAYITDDLELTLRISENNRSKILKMLRSGTPVSVIENKSSGYTLVRAQNGIEGYILTRHLKNQPAAQWFLNQANNKILELEKENEAIKNDLASLRGDSSEATSSNQSIILERDKLISELAEIKQTAANAIEIKNQRDQLQERIVSVERELLQVKRENQALQDNTSQDWFLYGGFLSLIGVLLGYLLPKLGWGRRSSSWDTF